MKLFDFIKEVLRGKTLFRVILFVGLKELFNQENWLNQSFKILELGSEPASHQRAFPSAWQLTTTNVKTGDKVDFLLDAEQKFSLTEASYDGVAIFNVLYLLNNYRQCLNEALRVADKFVIFNIPLVAALAPQPHDFNRFTPDRIKEILEDLKQTWPLMNYQIVPLGGSFTSAVNGLDVYLKFRIIRLPVYLLARALDGLDKMIKRQCPLQYLVLIRKT